jgi:NADH-quinone oxidoreductase subunit A
VVAGAGVVGGDCGVGDGVGESTGVGDGPGVGLVVPASVGLGVSGVGVSNAATPGGSARTGAASGANASTPSTPAAMTLPGRETADPRGTHTSKPIGRWEAETHLSSPSRARARVASVGFERTIGRMGSYLESYATLGLLLVVGAGVFVAAFSANRLVRPARPNPAPDKFDTYECGLDPVGGDWAQAQIRYYLYAFLYVLFAVESVFLFPWAVIYARPEFGHTAVAEMGIFVGVLALGLLYSWRKGVLRWA